MIKKLWFMAVVLLSITLLISCEKQVDSITLPNLNGMTSEQAISMLSQYPLVVATQQIIDNDIPEGRFVSYNNDYQAGDIVDKYTSIIAYFSIHVNLLPNLSGKTQAQVLSELSKLDIIIEVQTYMTNDFPNGTFLSYGNGLRAGDVLENGDEVLVYIAQSLPPVNRGIIISKYLEGTSTNKAIELYNTTGESIDLSTYKLSIYSDGSETTTHEISLTGIINSEETFLIVAQGSEPSLISMADFVTNELIFNGNDTIALNDESDQIVDIVGTIGWGLYYLSDRTLVRDISITEATDEFSIDDWDEYMPDDIELLGSHPVIYPTTFTFDTAFLTVPFTEPGGMIEVDYVSTYDGDTAYFTPGFIGDNRVRFIGIDTTEMSSGTLATQARNFVASLLSNATTVYLQHDPESGIIETYGRTLALVWADGVLVNYGVVLHGYSQNNYQDPTHALIFNNIPLSTWMTNAEKYAKENHLGVWA